MTDLCNLFCNINSYSICFMLVCLSWVLKEQYAGIQKK